MAQVIERLILVVIQVMNLMMKKSKTKASPAKGKAEVPSKSKPATKSVAPSSSFSSTSKPTKSSTTSPAVVHSKVTIPIMIMLQIVSVVNQTTNRQHKTTRIPVSTLLANTIINTISPCSLLSQLHLLLPFCCSYSRKAVMILFVMPR